MNPKCQVPHKPLNLAHNFTKKQKSRMSHNKVPSQGAVPFSWEKRPGVSKVAAHWDCSADVGQFGQKLPPPPCPPESARASFHELPVPLPPVFQLPTRSSSRRGIRKQDDPFLNAYRECTKGSIEGKDGGRFRLGKNMNFLSCKHSVSVRDDSMVRISKLPNSKSGRDREL
ncbi:hypothetical protein RHSIM_Rhsim07G0217500 [Rhododendron simsii]|uniref:Uncharacterized protein n=1 Tax=Rhododendron simsii TaxID=118357 RepID=A0A834LHY4_RHOSS|nr:hypothetical protein RHSIM_Rhsim07G0217500 [Rhododendron simsii]